MDTDRDLLLISIFTFFTVCLWITFELIKTFKTSTITTTTQQIVQPLNPKIDGEILTIIAGKKIF